MLFCLIAVYFYFSYQKDIESKKQISCQESGIQYLYDKQTDSCKAIVLGEQEDKSNMYLCDFSVQFSNTNVRHMDGQDTELIANLEEKCRGGEDILSKFACLNLETEKNNEYHITYYNLEGVLTTNGDEHLQYMGVELNTANAKRASLGTEIISFEKDVKFGEETPFSVTIAIDRGKEDIADVFDKEDEVFISTYPVYSTCR